MYNAVWLMVTVYSLECTATFVAVTHIDALFLSNVGNYPPNCTVSQPTTQQCYS